MQNNKHLYIIAGPNGAGKTTAAFTILPEVLHCEQFVNADEIARGLSPFHPEQVAVTAGKLMLQRIDELLTQQVDFAIETTLAAVTYANLIEQAHKTGYTCHLLFFWLESAEHAKQRVAKRVNEGGHDIPIEVIERRYARGLRNLVNLYLPICDEVLVVNNSVTPYKIIAKKGSISAELIVYQHNIWNKITNCEI